MHPSKPLVIASNRRQFEIFCWEMKTNPNVFQYVSNDYNLHGYDRGTVIIWLEPWLDDSRSGGVRAHDLAEVCHMRGYKLEYYQT